MAAALPKRHLVAVHEKAPEFRLLVFYTRCYAFKKSRAENGQRIVFGRQWCVFTLSLFY